MSARQELLITDLDDAAWESTVEVADNELRAVAGSLRMLGTVSTCHQSGGYDCD